MSISEMSSEERLWMRIDQLCLALDKIKELVEFHKECLVGVNEDVEKIIKEVRGNV